VNEKIPILDLKAQTRGLQAEIMAAFERVLSDAAFIRGPEVRLFQEEFAAYLGVKYAIGVANGTDALVLALRALGIGPGDEVITTPFTFIATAECISLVGATPVFADIEPGTFNLDPARVAERIGPRTKAIICVHLYGNPCRVQALKEMAERHGIALVEDCAQAAGAEIGGQRVGSVGDVGCFSFFPSKNLGGFGDAGCVTTSRADLADNITAIADHGSRVKYHHDLVGTNSRLDTLQAAVLRIKLRHLETWNERRRHVAARYTAALSGSGIVTPVETEGGRHVYHQYTVRVPTRRDAVHQWLNENGVGAVVYYPISLHQQPVYRAQGYGAQRYPVSEEAQAQVLSLPMFPELDDERVDRIAGKLLEASRASLGGGSPAPTPAVPAAGRG